MFWGGKSFISSQYLNHNRNTHKYKTQVDFAVQVRTHLLTSDFGSSILTPSRRTAHLVVFKIAIHFRWSGPKKLNRRCNGRELNYQPQWQRTRLSAWMVQCQPSTLRFLKTINSQPIPSGHDIIHTQAPFPVWVFIMTMAIVISFARERKTVPYNCAPELRAKLYKAQPNWMIKYN